MLGLSPAPARVWLVVEPMDMRLAIDGLSSRLQQSLGRSPCDGTAYAFRNRLGTRTKLLQWDGTGVWLSQRRLHRGSFVWPSVDERLFTLSQAQWQWLISGVDIEVGCMAHARRKFFELHKANQSPVAGEASQRIAELYAIESRGRELANSARRDLREREALPNRIDELLPLGLQPE